MLHDSSLHAVISARAPFQNPKPARKSHVQGFSEAFPQQDKTTPSSVPLL